MRSLDPDDLPVDDETPVDEGIRGAGIPQRYRTASWESWVPPAGLDNGLRQDLERLEGWRGEPSIVTLTGPPGSGKTHLATAVLRRVIEQRVAQRGSWWGGLRWRSVAGLLERLRDELAGRAQAGALDDAVTAALLVLDDLGAVRDTDWTVDRLSYLLSARYDACRPTVITTNLILNQIRDRLDARIASRLAEGLVIRLDLPDHRLAGLALPVRKLEGKGAIQ